MITQIEEIDPEEFAQVIDVLNLMEDTERELTYKTHCWEYEDVNYNYHTEAGDMWYVIPDEIQREARYQEIDIMPYRVSDEKWIVESNVEMKNVAGLIGDVKIRVANECPDCNGCVEYWFDMQAGCVAGECVVCGKSGMTGVRLCDMDPTE